MKDKQAKIAATLNEIPLISPVLHCFSIPVILFWRSNFGYSYLRPKSIFLASATASFIYGYIVYHELPEKKESLPLALFLCSASSLYLLHLTRSIWRESRRTARHDQDSGSSQLLKLFPPGRESPEAAERQTQWLLEPALTIAIGILIQLLVDHSLGKLIFYMGIALFLKETLRSWLTLRKKKRLEDLEEDAEESAPIPASTNLPTPQPKVSGRKPRAKRKRIAQH